MSQARRATRVDCLHDWATAPDYNCDRCIERTRELLDRTGRALARPHDVDDVVSEALDEIIRRQKYDPRRGSFPRFVRMVVKTATMPSVAGPRATNGTSTQWDDSPFSDTRPAGPTGRSEPTRAMPSAKPSCG